MATPLTFSIIINTCDRSDSLRTLLYALHRQTYPHFEVIVVVGPTKDNSVEVVEEFTEQVILGHCAEFNLSMSRNIGIAMSAGEIVAFIDDDAIPCPTWLEQLATAFTHSGTSACSDVSGAGGRVYQVHPGYGQLQFRYGLFSLFAEDADVRNSPTEKLLSVTPAKYWYPRLMGTNMAYRRQDLVDGGGFDERFAYLFEEPDLAIRLGQQGYKIHHCDEAVVYHAPASSRNREMFTWNINWYMWMRGGVYFILKNAHPIVGWRVAMWKATQYALNFFARVRDHRIYDTLPADLYPNIVKQLRRGAVWGFGVGLFGKRQIAANFAKPDRKFQPFLTKQSKLFPHIKPLPPLRNQKVNLMDHPPLQICLLSKDYPPRHTEGIARLTHFMAQGLSELGHEVHVITEGKVHRTTFYDGAYIHEIVADRHRYPMYQSYANTAWQLNYGHAIQQKVRSLQLNHQIQVVDSPLWSLEGLVTAVAQDVPLVIRLATGMRQIVDINQDTNPDTRLISDLEVEFLKLCQGFTANSLATTQTLQQVYGLEFTSKPHEVIYHGIIPLPNEAVFPLDAQSKASPIVLFVGRLEKRKGILTLFEAIPHVLQEFPQAQFWLAGKDNSANDGFAQTQRYTYPQYFQKKYSAYQEQVKFLGYVADDKLGQLYQVCDLFVAPSLYESFGLIFLEAMNQARPVIGCNVGGPTEIIVPNETGLLVTPESSAELATAIIQLLSQPKARCEMGLAGRERLLSHFTYLKMAEKYVAFYRRLLRL